MDQQNGEETSLPQLSSLKEDIKEIKQGIKEICIELKGFAVLNAQQSERITFLEEKQKGMMNWAQGLMMMFFSTLLGYLSYFLGGGKK